MQLIEALVMVTQIYNNREGWIIRRQGEHIQKIQASVGARYASYAPGLLRASSQLEIVLAALAEHNPTATRDSDWQISPFPKEEHTP